MQLGYVSVGGLTERLHSAGLSLTYDVYCIGLRTSTLLREIEITELKDYQPREMDSNRLLGAATHYQVHVKYKDLTGE